MDAKTIQQAYITLNNGLSMPLLGLGTFLGPKDTVCQDDALNAVEYAISCGYRHIDTAWIYNTEKAVGQAIRNKVVDGTVKRENVFVTSKLSFYHHEVSGVKSILRESLQNLGLDYLDLYLIHSPFAAHMPDPSNKGSMPLNQNNDLLAIWKELESCVSEGLVRSIGVSNFNARQLQNILDHCSIRPVTNQCEIHLYLQNEKLREYCAERDVVMTAYTPLGKPFVKASDWTSPLDNDTVKIIASKYGKTAAQIALRFQIQRGVVVIPKSTNPGRIKENSEVFTDFILDEADMKSLRSLERGARAFCYPKFKDHKDFPLGDEF